MRFNEVSSTSLLLLAATAVTASSDEPSMQTSASDVLSSLSTMTEQTNQARSALSATNCDNADPQLVMLFNQLNSLGSAAASKAGSPSIQARSDKLHTWIGSAAAQAKMAGRSIGTRATLPSVSTPLEMTPAQQGEVCSAALEFFQAANSMAQTAGNTNQNLSPCMSNAQAPLAQGLTVVREGFFTFGTFLAAAAPSCSSQITTAQTELTNAFTNTVNNLGGSSERLAVAPTTVTVACVEPTAVAASPFARIASLLGLLDGSQPQESATACASAAPANVIPGLKEKRGYPAPPVYDPVVETSYVTKTKVEPSYITKTNVEPVYYTKTDVETSYYTKTAVETDYLTKTDVKTAYYTDYAVETLYKTVTKVQPPAPTVYYSAPPPEYTTSSVVPEYYTTSTVPEYYATPTPTGYVALAAQNTPTPSQAGNFLSNILGGLTGNSGNLKRQISGSSIVGSSTNDLPMTYYTEVSNEVTNDVVEPLNGQTEQTLESFFSELSGSVEQGAGSASDSSPLNINKEKRGNPSYEPSLVEPSYEPSYEPTVAAPYDYYGSVTSTPVYVAVTPTPSSDSPEDILEELLGGLGGAAKRGFPYESSYEPAYAPSYAPSYEPSYAPSYEPTVATPYDYYSSVMTTPVYAAVEPTTTPESPENILEELLGGLGGAAKRGFPYESSYEPAYEPTYAPSYEPSYEPTVATPYEYYGSVTSTPVYLAVTPTPSSDSPEDILEGLLGGLGGAAKRGAPYESSSCEPTEEPTYTPYEPTYKPSYEPAPKPSYEPAPEPSYEPAPKPSYTPSYEPTYKPSYEPTYKPSYEPTPKATYEPAPKPSYEPAPKPSYEPAPKPSYTPIYKPSYEPTYKPTLVEPSYKPTEAVPSYTPTVAAPYEYYGSVTSTPVYLAVTPTPSSDSPEDILEELLGGLGGAAKRDAQMMEGDTASIYTDAAALSSSLIEEFVAATTAVPTNAKTSPLDTILDMLDGAAR